MTAELDGLFRLLAAVGVGIAVGVDRDLSGKPIGMRTLALVSLGAAVVALASTGVVGIAAHPDALSRAIQGVVQGVLTGVGFIGAGVILRDPGARRVEGLTTAATVWVTAALGIACGFAAWRLVLVGTGLVLVILYGLRWIEHRLGTPHR